MNREAPPREWVVLMFLGLVVFILQILDALLP